MHVDMIIAFSVFLIFVIWGFSYYSTIFADTGENMGNILSSVYEKVLGFLAINVYDTPVHYNSTGPASNAVLYLTYTWSSGTKNSTRILLNGQQLPCIISGNTLYWQTDLVAGTNYFVMRTTNQDENMNCIGGFDTGNANQTIPWVEETKQMISQNRIDRMESMDYVAFKNILGIDRNFRIEINRTETGNMTVYGADLPPITNVYSKQSWYKIFESNQKAELTVSVW